MIDCQKQQLTVYKHGVSFEEAKTVFENVLAVIFDDGSSLSGWEARDYWALQKQSLAVDFFHRAF